MIISCHVAREVSSDTALMRVVYLLIRPIISVDFLFYMRLKVVKYEVDQGALLPGLRV